MIEFLKAVLFGIIEGITEWLPISSTGHMILLDEFVKLNVSPEFWEMFLVVIQLGAILAVVVLFFPQIWPFGRKNNPYPVAEKGLLSYCKKYNIINFEYIQKKAISWHNNNIKTKEEAEEFIKN